MTFWHTIDIKKIFKGRIVWILEKTLHSFHIYLLFCLMFMRFLKSRVKKMQPQCSNRGVSKVFFNNDKRCHFGVGGLLYFIKMFVF